MALNKRSVINANKEAADLLWETFQKENLKEEAKAKGIEFRKRDLSKVNCPSVDNDPDKVGEPLMDGSFEIIFTAFNKEGKRKETPIFRFLKKKCGNEIQWNNEIVKINR